MTTLLFLLMITTNEGPPLRKLQVADLLTEFWSITCATTRAILQSAVLELRVDDDERTGGRALSDGQQLTHNLTVLSEVAALHVEVEVRPRPISSRNGDDVYTFCARFEHIAGGERALSRKHKFRVMTQGGQVDAKILERRLARSGVAVDKPEEEGAVALILRQECFELRLVIAEMVTLAGSAITSNTADTRVDEV